MMNTFQDILYSDPQLGLLNLGENVGGIMYTCVWTYDNDKDITYVQQGNIQVTKTHTNLSLLYWLRNHVIRGNGLNVLVATLREH